jgi:hypothetical protein
MKIKLVPDHKGNIAYVSKVAGSDGLGGNGERFVAGSNYIRTWNDYPTCEQAAEAWNAGATYNPDTHVVVPKVINNKVKKSLKAVFERYTYRLPPYTDIYKAMITAAQEKSE